MRAHSWKLSVQDERPTNDTMLYLNRMRLSTFDLEGQESYFFEKILSESLGIQLGRPLLFDASTAEAKC